MGTKMKRGGSDEKLNYSLGILIILLMGFWFICKCIGNNSYKTKCKESMLGGPYKSGLYYGNSPISIGSKYGINHIIRNNGVIEVPNSKTAMRHLYDELAYKSASLERNSDNDDKQVAMHLNKRDMKEDIKGPRSKTASHELMCGSEHGKDSSYF
jgi:hypothetical protein